MIFIHVCSNLYNLIITVMCRLQINIAKVILMSNYRPAPRFIADALGLDFLNALVGEEILDAEGFLKWIEETRLVPQAAMAKLRVDAAPGELDAVAAQARTLGSWFRGFVKDYKGKTLPASAVDRLRPLNRILERDARIGRVDARDNLNDRIAGSGLRWTSQRVWRSPDTLLLPIAQAMAELVCSEDFGNVRACEGYGCELLFLDRTRGRVRRWCSMAVRGNRAKQATRRSSRET
jgi:predicted RNA-binding Zn ribbon-like protein